MSEYILQKGCIPCSFICDCCDLHCYRCSTGIDMYYKGDRSRPTRILCGECYRHCLDSVGCEVQRMNEEPDVEEE